MTDRPASDALAAHRVTIRALVARHRAANPRVFGSAATGADGADSDLDLLVEPTEATTLFDLGHLQEALEEALGLPVDVVTPGDLSPRLRAEALARAVPM